MIKFSGAFWLTAEDDKAAHEQAMRWFEKYISGGPNWFSIDEVREVND